jgi:serine/threonine protein kinase
MEDSLEQLDELGGIYIKFMQMVVLSSSGITQRNFIELLRVYEASKPDTMDVWDHLKKIGMPGRGNIKGINPEPFATGSFGQVYKGILNSGDVVIIKVLRPSVKRYLRYDLRLLGFLCRIFSILDRQRMLDFKQIYGQFKETCLQEIQYKREAEIASYYYRQYENHPQMVIPKTYRNMSNDQVIVQEYIDGLSLAKLLSSSKGNFDAREYVYQNFNSDLFKQLEIIGVELLSKALIGEVVQADPHPGNIIILRDNKVALIDFGMAASLNENRLAFYELLLQYKAYYSNDFKIEDMSLAALKYLSPKLFSAIANADKILGDSYLTEESLLDKLRTATKKVVNENNTKTVIEGMLKQNLIMKVLFFEINRNNRFGFNFDLKAVNLLKATQGYMTLIGQFDHDAEIITSVINCAVERANKNIDKIIDSNVVDTKPLESIEILSSWIDKMYRNDPWLTNQLVGGYMR